MPKAVKGSKEERAQFMAEVFRQYYSNPEHAGRDLSIQKANDQFRTKFGSMLRNKAAYAIRSSVKAQLQGGGTGARQASRMAKRDPGAGPVAPGSGSGAVLIEGTQDQLKWLTSVVLPVLKGAGLAAAHVDHTTDKYAVVAKN